ncbi:MAG TPA: flagellar basal body rod protein FlgC [Rhodospirillaceae bacterium]|jgi:flagellar basal-body rod protein FlgC|nr:flagellar basal body rod protein FlgC [Alphaproteobacteria bacterium]HBH26129.1 flagellar basal body rod protein FlgC [Rhodospirillaceae bacterium]
MDISDSIVIAAAGMRAQGARLRVVTENLANADSAAKEPGGEPYRRKVITFRNEVDRATGLPLVRVGSIEPDTRTPFSMALRPGHPGADANGYVRMPNVESLIEVADAREAQRSYDANLGMIEQARAMITRTIDMLRG